MAAPEGEAADAAMDRSVDIWAAHEALWPGDAAAAEPPAYRKHQYQNIALGAMVRGELAKSYSKGSIRFSLGRYNTDADIDTTLRVLPSIIEKLARMSPYDKELAALQ